MVIEHIVFVIPAAVRSSIDTAEFVPGRSLIELPNVAVESMLVMLPFALPDWSSSLRLECCF